MGYGEWRGGRWGIVEQGTAGAGGARLRGFVSPGNHPRSTHCVSRGVHQIEQRVSAKRWAERLGGLSGGVLICLLFAMIAFGFCAFRVHVNSSRIIGVPFTVKLPWTAPKVSLDWLPNFLLRDSMAMREHTLYRKGRRLQRLKSLGEHSAANPYVNQVRFIWSQEQRPERMLLASFPCIRRNHQVSVADGNRKRSIVHEVHLNSKAIGWSLGSPVFKFYPLVELRLRQVRLPLNFHESFLSGTYSPPSHDYQSTGEASSKDCGDYHPSINILFSVGLSLFFGGFNLALWATVHIENDRRILRRALTGFGIGCAEGVLVFWIAFGFHPHSWGLPPQWLPAKWNPCPQDYRDYFPHGQIVTQKHLTPVWFLYYSKDMANVLAPEKQIAVIGSLCEGSSIRAIERMTGVHRDTVMRLGVRVGQGCTAMMNENLRDLDSTRLEMDEIWGFIGKKEKHVRPTDDPTTGDVWTFCAIDADSKLVPTFKVGKRTNAVADAFVQDVASRMRNRVQISTDGLKAYVDAIEHSFGGNVDYAQIIKTYGHEEVSNNRRYSAPEFVASEKRPIFGNPDFDLISTSYVERLNATTRLHMRRLTRLTLAFSKKLENFEAAVGLHFAYYNFVKRHITLRATPAQAAGVTGTQWTVAQLLKAVA
jgi:IS1 family transposase